MIRVVSGSQAFAYEEVVGVPRCRMNPDRAQEMALSCCTNCQCLSVHASRFQRVSVMPRRLLMNLWFLFAVEVALLEYGPTGCRTAVRTCCFVE